MSDEKRVCLHESGMVAKHGQLSVYSLDAVRAALAVHGLALVPAADAPTPISDETLRHLRECALAWEFCLELARLRAAMPPEERALLEAWTHQHGAALVPHGGWADTFGDGMRCAKQQVAALLARRAGKKSSDGC